MSFTFLESILRSLIIPPNTLPLPGRHWRTDSNISVLNHAEATSVVHALNHAEATSVVQSLTFYIQCTHMEDRTNNNRRVSPSPR